MKFNDNNFHVNNWAEFVHKNVLPQMLKYVAETHINDISDVKNMLSVEYQRDANGEYRLLVTYVDRNGETQQQILNPAITSRVLDLCNQEIVKHFLYTKNGQDVYINQMKFNNDKLYLNLVDGDQIELDLKPLVPRINVVNSDGEVLQKNLNYHINDDMIVFVDLEGNETTLDFKKLLKVDAFNEFKTVLHHQLTDLDEKKVDKTIYETNKANVQNQIDAKVAKTDFSNYQSQVQNQLDEKENIVDNNEKLSHKVNQVDYNQFVDDTRSELDTKAGKVKMASELSKKEDKIDHNSDIDRLQNQINDRSTHAETDQAVTRTITQIKEWANPIHDDLLAKFNDYVTKTIFSQLQQKVDDLQTTKLDKTEYEQNQQNYVKTTDLADYVTKNLLATTLADYYAKGVIDEKLNSKVNNSDLVADYYNKTDVDALINTINSQLADYYNKGVIDEKLNSKVNNSDLVADYYNKTDVDALINTINTQLNQKANRNEFSDDTVSAQIYDTTGTAHSESSSYNPLFYVDDNFSSVSVGKRKLHFTLLGDDYPDNAKLAKIAFSPSVFDLIDSPFELDISQIVPAMLTIKFTDSSPIVATLDTDNSDTEHFIYNVPTNLQNKTISKYTSFDVYYLQ